MVNATNNHKMAFEEVTPEKGATNKYSYTPNAEKDTKLTDEF
jgi:hypothetical protein